MNRQYPIQIYTTYKNQIPKMSFVQHDTEVNKIYFEMFDDINVPMTNIYEATGTVQRPDNKTYTYGMVDENNKPIFIIEDNLVTFILPPSAVYVDGECHASVSLYDENYGRLSTQTFKFTVTPELISDTPIDETNEYPVLTKLLVAGQSEIDRQASEDIRISSENTRVASENTRLASEAVRVTNEVTRVSNEDTRIANENIRISKMNAFETDITNGNTLKATLEADITSGTILRNMLDGDISIGNATRADLEVVIATANTTTYATKGDVNTINSSLNTINSSLNDIVSQTSQSYKKSTSSTQNLPMVTFICDDGYLKDFTEYLPIFQSKGAVFCSAIIPDVMSSTNPTYMRLEQVLALQNAGCEILSHSKSHVDLSAITDENQLETEIYTSLQTLKSLGLNTESIVYPYNAYSDLSLKHIAKYYRSGFSLAEISNSLPLNQLALYRRTFGSNGVLYDLAGYQSLVDEAKANNKWLVFMCHSNDDTTEQRAYLAPLLDYIISQNIPIVTVKQALDKIENRLTIGRLKHGSETVDKIFAIGADGSLKSSYLDSLNSINYANLTIANNAVTEATLLSSFPVNKVTVNVLDTNGSQNMPETKTGVLETYVMGSPIKIAFQLWYPRTSSTCTTVYKRWWNDVSLVWEAFVKISDGNITSKQMFSQASSVDHGTLTAGQSKDISVTFTGVAPTDVVVATPQYGMTGGLIWNAYCDTADTVKIRVYNSTTGSLTCNRTWSIFVYKK